MIIRERRPADLDACVTALRHTHEADSYPLNWPDDPHRWLTPPRLLQAWVAEHPSGVIAGHVVLQQLADCDEPAAELSRLYVTPAARRRSIASALLTRAQEWASGRRLRLTLAVTDERRSAAVAFYEAKGWQYTHSAQADWLAPDGGNVTLRHYAWSKSARCEATCLGWSSEAALRVRCAGSGIGFRRCGPGPRRAPHVRGDRDRPLATRHPPPAARRR